MKGREVFVASLSELDSGEMKEVEIGEQRVLLARVGDKCYAVGAHCTHYGAPLVDGAMVGDRIICPWHHACFDMKTGDLVEPPAFDSLPSYEVKTKGDEIFVLLPPDQSEMDRRVPIMTKRAASDSRLFVILGGGAAGFMAAQTLREDGFTGRIVMITREDRAPYDRPNLSKEYLQGHAEPEWMPLRPDDFFVENDIEILKEWVAINVDPVTKEITFDDGQILSYDSMLIATGGIPRPLPFQTRDQANVHILRSFSDSDALVAAAGKGTRAVVIGAGFIGMETASSLRIRGCEVTVVAPDKVPFEKILGTEIGKLFQSIHERKGVQFKLGTSVKALEGDGKVEAVILDNGELLDADLVVVGVGVSPATDFIDGLTLHRDGGVVANKYLEIADDLYAAGDIVHFPDPRTSELARIEHWRTAMQQGRTAAHNMAGNVTEFTSVPFFWTTQFGVSLRYVGHAKEWDRIILDGDLDEQDFLAVYIKDDKVLAVAGIKRDRELAIWEERIRKDEIPRQIGVEKAIYTNNSAIKMARVPGLF